MIFRDFIKVVITDRSAASTVSWGARACRQLDDNIVILWGQQLADNLSQQHRTFFADCPAKGAPLTEPLPGVGMLRLDVQAVATRLRDEVRGIEDAAAVWVPERDNLARLFFSRG